MFIRITNGEGPDLTAPSYVFGSLKNCIKIFKKVSTSGYFSSLYESSFRIFITYTWCQTDSSPGDIPGLLF